MMNLNMYHATDALPFELSYHALEQLVLIVSSTLNVKILNLGTAKQRFSSINHRGATNPFDEIILRLHDT